MRSLNGSIFCDGLNLRHLKMPMKNGEGDSHVIPSSVPAFLVKLWKLVEDPQYDEHISWNKVSIILVMYINMRGIQYARRSKAEEFHPSVLALVHRLIVLRLSCRSPLLFSFARVDIEWHWFSCSRSSYFRTGDSTEVFQAQQLRKLRSAAQHV